MSGVDDETIEDAVEDAVEEERRATNLELFLDLAFVFAVAQVTVGVSSTMTWAGAARGLLIAWLVWWLWTQFAWMGTAVNLDEDRRGRAAVMVSIPAALVMAATLPEAFGANGALFGVAYFLAQGVALVVLGASMWSSAATRATFFSYGAAGSVGPTLVLVGSLLPTAARTVVWVIAAVFGIAGALLSGRSDEPDHAWNINPAHFSERHALVIIIVLGELLIAAGAASGSAGITGGVIAALVAVAVLACVLWWIYFAYIPQVTEQALREQPPVRRGTMARDLFSFGHFPMVFGVILVAVVGKSVVKHPGDPLDPAYRVALSAAIVLLVAGFMWMHFRYVRGVAAERPITVALVIGLIWLAGPHVSGVVTVALVAAVLLCMHAYTVRRRISPQAQPARSVDPMERTSSGST